MRAVTSVASNYGRFLVGIASVFLVTPRAIEALGVAQFGLWTLAAATCGVIALMELGLTTTSMRFAAEADGAGDAGLRDARLSTLLAVQLPLAMLMVVAGWLGAPLAAAALGLAPDAARDYTIVVRIGSVAAALAVPLSLWRAALAARGGLHLANGADALSIALGAGLSLAGLASGLGVWALAWGTAATLLLPAPVLWIAVRRRVPDLRLSLRLASRDEWARMRSFAGAAVSTNSANLAMQRLEPMVINGFLPLQAVGQYSIAARLAEYILLLGRQLSSALTPAVARAHGAGDVNALRTTLLLGTRFQLALLLPCSFLLAWHAPAFLHAWLGSGVEDAVLPLRLLCVSIVMAALAMNPAICLGMTGRHRLVAQAAVAGALLRLTAGALLVARFGLAGAGVAAIVVAMVFDVGLVVTRACRHVGVPIRSFVAGAVVPTLAGVPGMLLTAWWLEHWQAPASLAAIMLQSVAAGSAYLVIFAAVGVPRHRRPHAPLQPALAREPTTP